MLFNVGWVFVLKRFFFCEGGSFLFSYLWWSHNSRKDRLLSFKSAGRITVGDVRFLSLIGGKLENSFNLRTFKRCLKSKVFTIPADSLIFFVYSTKCHLQINSALHTWLHVHRNAFMHVQRDGYLQPFPAGPCRCSRNRRVGLSGKQTVRGCWESSLGLQIIVRLTKVSEPAPLLLHTHTACIRPHHISTHKHMRLCTLKALQRHTLKAHIQSDSNGTLSALEQSQE